MTGPPPLALLRPRRDTLYVSRGRIALATGLDGFIDAGTAHGLFVHETRMLSRSRYLIDGRRPEPVALSNLAAHRWLGYYILSPAGAALADEGSGVMTALSEDTLELRLRREVGDTLEEEARLTNYTGQPVRLRLTVELDADFADVQEAGRRRIQTGTCARAWAPVSDGGTLRFDYHAEHAYDHQGGQGTALLHRSLDVRVEAPSPATVEGGALAFDVALAPRASWTLCLTFSPRLEEGLSLGPPGGAAEMERRAALYRSKSASFSTPASETLASLVQATLDGAREDLLALRLFDLDDGDRAWVAAAGLPVYLAIYGRDALTAGWQAGLLGPEGMEGALAEIALLQGTVDDPWRDEQPGRMLHEAHSGPLKALRYNPFGRYYGSLTTSAFYPVVASELWHWTGDRDLAFRFLDPALKALRWLDEHGDLDGDGFYEYRTRSDQGVKHQAWKDGPGAIVYVDGGEVEPPIATCEEQGFVYLSKLHLAELLWSLGNRDEAKRLYREAEGLKARFNEAFWLEDEGFYAMGLDANKRPIRSIGSNPLHCLATAIAEADRAERVVERLFQPDLFSGWGVRTLSSDHPAFNPYSYHRGSVWPVENGTFAIALMRYGLWDRLHELCRAQFEAASLFEHHRLPEVFSGHARTAEQPFPALYPQSNSPQAWSASAVFCFVQAMLGLYPYAPLRTLVVDPHLPEWLPELTVRGLRVGPARATIRFYRKADGSSSYHVEAAEGTLHVVQQPSPWSVTAGLGERIFDLIRSALPGK